MTKVNTKAYAVRLGLEPGLCCNTQSADFLDLARHIDHSDFHGVEIILPQAAINVNNGSESCVVRLLIRGQQRFRCGPSL